MAVTGSAPVLRPSSARAALRITGAAEALAGAALATRPVTVAALAGGTPPPLWIVRVLGARMVAQGVLEIARPAPAVAMGGAVVDGSHALSMVAAAVLSRRFRRPALASAALAGLTSTALLGVFARAASHPRA